MPLKALRILARRHCKSFSAFEARAFPGLCHSRAFVLMGGDVVRRPHPLCLPSLFISGILALMLREWMPVPFVPKDFCG